VSCPIHKLEFVTGVQIRIAFQGANPGVEVKVFKKELKISVHETATDIRIVQGGFILHVSPIVECI